MIRNFSIVIGGSKGNGLEIVKTLKKRGDYVFNISRSKSKIASKNIQVDLLDDNYLKEIKKEIKNKKIKSLIFSQKYRGNKTEEEFQVMIKACKDIIFLLKNNFKKYGSVIFLSTTATKVIADQNIDYYIAQSAREMMAKYLAVKFEKNSVRFNSILLSRLIKKENRNYILSNLKLKKMLTSINPLKRIPTSKDTAFLVEYLTSDKSIMINGESITVDGGLNLFGQEELVKNYSK